MTKQGDNSAFGQFIPLQYYTIITSLTATLVYLGFVGVTWYVTKKTRNVLLHTTLLISLVNTIPKLFAAKQKLKRWSHYAIISMVIIAIPLSSLDVLMNLYADVYISVGPSAAYTSQPVASLGPLAYNNQSASILTLLPDKTNTPTTGALGSLLSNSVLLQTSASAELPNTFKYDKSCDSLSNVLLNSAISVADSSYQIVPSTFTSAFWRLPISSNIAQLVSVIWALGPQVSPVVKPSPSNILNLVQLSMAVNGSAQFSSTTAQVWFPVVGSNSNGSTYIYSEGTRGRVDDPQYWATIDSTGPTPGSTYDTNGTYAPPSNDTLDVRMVEVVDTSFGPTAFTSGPALACFTYWFLDGQDAKCVVNLRQNKTAGTETYDVIVLVEPQSINLKRDASLSPVANLNPVSSPVFLDYDQTKNSVTVSVAPLLSNVLFVDSPLSIGRFKPIDPAVDKLLGDNQIFLTTAYHYTVTIKSQSLHFYSNASSNRALTTTMVSALQPFAGTCNNYGTGTSAGKGLFTDKSYLGPGTAAVLITYVYMVILILLFIVAFLFFWYNDQFLLPLRYIGQPFKGLTGDVILEKSWIGVAEHERMGWQVEVLSLGVTHKQTYTCSSFTEAENMRLKLIQQDIDSGRAEAPPPAVQMN